MKEQYQPERLNGASILPANGHAAISAWGKTTKDIEGYTAGRKCYKTTNARHPLLQTSSYIPFIFPLIPSTASSS
jgi:hypothetical protein